MLLLFQEVPTVSPFISLGVGGVIAGLVLSLWRQDRNESQQRYTQLAKESNERAASIASDFRTIVQDNTRAITALAEKLNGVVLDCPYKFDPQDRSQSRHRPL
jgi:hypothetical protein